MLEELLKEISELQKYKHKYESQKKDKERMSEELYKLMKEKYEATTLEERLSLYKKEMCRCCRNGSYSECSVKLPDNIGEPIRSDKEWFPAKTGCGHFEWD